MGEAFDSQAMALMAALAAAMPASGALRLVPAVARPRAGTPSGLPVLRWLDEAVRKAPPRSAPALAVLLALAPELAWRQTYRRDETEAAFLDNYGWTELVGAKGLFQAPALSAGVLVLGPHTYYPPHSHPATEHYVPLSGAAEWCDEDHGWRRVPPLTLVPHRAHVRHAMRTGDDPLVAYYLWTGEGLEESARLNPARA